MRKWQKKCDQVMFFPQLNPVESRPLKVFNFRILVKNFLKTGRFSDQLHMRTRPRCLQVVSSYLNEPAPRCLQKADRPYFFWVR